MTTPTGIISLPLSYLKASLAACAAFQTWVSAASAAAALTSIHLVSTASLAIPAAVVSWGGVTSFDRIADRTFEQYGELEVRFYGVVTTETDAALGDESIIFGNTVGGILAELVALGPTGGYLDVVGFSHGAPMRPQREEANTGGDYHRLDVLVRYRGSV